jgi:hypothetical protein
MRKELFIIISLLCLTTVFSLAINEPKEIYQVGDKLYLTITDLRGYPNGNLNVDLNCGNETVNILKLSARAFSEDGGQAYSIPYKIISSEDLEIESVNSIIGNCYIKVNLASEVIETKKFIISNNLNMEASIDKIKYNPNEEVKLNINVKRADGEKFSGYYKLFEFSNKNGNFSDGEAEIVLNVEGNKEPGSFFLGIEVFDLDSKGEILNKANKSLFIIVNQVPTSVENAISKVDVVPGESLKLQPKLLDQVKQVMDGAIMVYLTDPDEEKYDYSVRSGETLDIPFKTNATKGIWKVYTVSGSFTKESQINVLGVERVNYTIENSVLRVSNVGNIDYFGEVKVKIGEYEERINIKLKVGEVKEYILEAPEGEYEIIVDDGENSYSTNGFLTGNAVNIREAGKSKTLRGFSLMWVFLIFLVGSLGIVMIGMYKRTNVVGTKLTFKEKIKRFGGKLNPLKGSQQKSKMIDYTNQKKIEKAESTLVLNGEKVNSTIISIKINDKEKFNEEIQKEIIKIIKECSGLKGVIDVKENYIYLIYSPLITKSFKNEMLAVSVALKVKSKLDNLKRTLRGGFNYGIGINSGDLVSEKTKSSLKYTGIGSTIVLSNKIATESNGEIYVSSVVRQSLLRDIKVSLIKEIDTVKVFKVDGVVNIEANRAKFNDLLKRADNKNINKNSKSL